MSTLPAPKFNYGGSLQAGQATARPIARLAPPPAANSTGLNEGLRSLALSTKRFGTTDWFIVHHRGDGPELLTEDALAHMRAEVVPLMIVAASSVERDLIVRELSRHLDALIPTPPDQGRGKLEVAELCVDQDAHRVMVDDVEVTLTSMEFKLLVLLVERRDCVQSRATLLRDVWHLSGRSRTRTVDTHIKRLRDKLGSAGRFFQSVRGIGYRFTVVDSAPRTKGRRDDESRPAVAHVVRPLLETA